MIWWEDEALQSDAYIEALLAANAWSVEPVPPARPRALLPVAAPDRAPGPAPAFAGGSGAMPARDPLALDDELAVAADVLARGLVRFHPSFRFEEALLSRLRSAADGDGAPGDDPDPAVRPFDDAGSAAFRPRADVIELPGLPPSREGPPSPARPPVWLDELTGFGIGRAVERMPLPVLAASAIASGFSIAGAAYVAWRLTRRPA